jgi:PKD repeat protein
MVSKPFINCGNTDNLKKKGFDAELVVYKLGFTEPWIHWSINWVSARDFTPLIVYCFHILEKMKRSLLAVAFAMYSFVAFANCTLIEVPLTQRTAASTDVVEGKVVDQYSYWNTSHNMIYTANVVELYKVFKGNLTVEKIEVLTIGGTVGFDRIKADPSLELIVGDYGMFNLIPVARFPMDQLSRNGLARFEVYASLQGFIKYDLVHNTAAEPFRTYHNIRSEVYDVVAVSTNKNSQYREIKAIDRNQFRTVQPPQQSPTAGPNIANFSPVNVTAGTGTVLTINGSSFGTTQGSSVVNFPNADDGGSTWVTPHATQYISWSDTQIRVEVPSGAGTGQFEVFTGITATSPSILTVDYAHLNVDFDPGSGTVAYQTDHINDNGSGGYTWRMNTGFDADASAKASFLRAFDQWRCNTAVNWTIGATTSINDAVSDGTNIICYDNTSPLSTGILGVCYSYWSGCASGPSIVWYVSELDIIFDEGSNIAPNTWEFGPSLPSVSEYDFETVAVHELGHGHQLGHVIAPGAIMHYAISNGSSNRSLGVNDDAGGTFVQGKSTTPNVCGPGAMSNYVCGTPPTAAFTGAPLTICAGQTVNFTDQSTGSPTGWTWTFTGGSPSSSSSQNPSVIYNTPGTYAVTLNVSNGSGSDVHTELAYITVNAGPTVTASSNPAPANVCSGDQVTLTAGGDASSYSWSGGITDGVAFTPASTLTYTVTGTGSNGCTSTATAAVTVNAAPSLSISSNPSNGIVCSGNQAALTASGAQSYSWTGGITNAVSFTPVATNTYTVTGTSAAGCTSTAQATITVQSCQSTTVNPNYCNLTNKVLYDWLYNVAVPGATNYEWRFTDLATSQVYVRARGANSPNMPLSWVAGLQYGHSYLVQVRPFVNGQWGVYGAGCNVSMAATPPTTQLNNSSCGAIGLTNTSWIYAVAVTGATSYNFTITNASLGYSQSRIRSVSNIRLSSFSGLQPNQTYTVTVLEYSGGAWSPVGATCTITTGGTMRMIPEGEETTEADEQLLMSELAVSMYPNPLGENQNPFVTIYGADGQTAHVNIYDLNGRMITTYEFYVEGNLFSTELSGFPVLETGMYMMEVVAGDERTITKFIAE